MNKVKMFFIAAALVLTTAGVFAAKHKFLSGGLVAYISLNNYKQLSVGSVGTDLLQGTGATQSKISDRSGFTYPVYYYDGSGNYTAVYSTTAW
jgi:hypothetical protein